MHKRIPINNIIEIVGRFSQGASLEEIMLGLASLVPRRTLQRWLSLLVHEKRLIASGKTRARPVYGRKADSKTQTCRIS